MSQPATLGDFGGDPPPRSLPQRWILAAAGPLVELYEANHGRIGGLHRPACSNIAAMFLRRDWGLFTSEALRHRVRGLIATGDRRAMAQGTGDADGLAAWDLARAAAVAGWGYVAYLLEADEAWSLMVEAARGLQSRFASWEQVAASYVAGWRIWNDEDDAASPPHVDQLLEPGGAWTLPWEVDLTVAIEPATEPLTVCRVGTGGDFSSISEAVAAAADRQTYARIEVAAGDYDESVAVRYPVELVGMGEVTVRANEGAPLLVRQVSAMVKGLKLISGTSAAGEAMQAVWADARYLRLVDCTMRSARCGVYTQGDDAFVSLSGCHIASAVNSGVLSEGQAHVAIDASVISGTEGNAVLATGGGELVIAATRIVAPGGSGIAATDAVHAELRDEQVEEAGENGIEIHGEGSASLRSVTVERAGSTGLLVNASVKLETSRVTHSGGNDLGLLSGQAIAARSTFGGGPGCAVCVCGGTRAELIECTLEATAMPTLYVMTEGAAELARCTVRGGHAAAIHAMGDASVRASRTLIEGDIEGAVDLVD